MVSVGWMKNGGRGFGSAPFFCCVHMWCVSKKRDTRYSLGACMVGVDRAGTRPRLRRHCPVLAALRSGLKRYAALPCRFAAAAQSRLRACGRFAGGRPLRRGAAAPAGSPAALRLLAAPAARLLRFAPAAVAARSAARPALAPRPLRGSPLCPCACWAALSLSPVAPVLRLRASPARVAAARPARPPRRALSRLSLPPGGCAALGLSPSLAALCGVPPPGVGLFCGWRGGAPAGAGLRTPRPPGAGGQGHIQKHHLSPILYLYFGGDMPTDDMSHTRQTSCGQSQES